jgi:fucose permease
MVGPLKTQVSTNLFMERCCGEKESLAMVHVLDLALAVLVCCLIGYFIMSARHERIKWNKWRQKYGSTVKPPSENIVPRKWHL